MKTGFAILLAGLVFFTLLDRTASADERAWPQFRGPNGNGVLESLNHPEAWSASQNIAWSVEVPGGGWSSPIVTGDQIFLTSAVGAKAPVGFAEGVRDMRAKRPDGEVQFKVFCLSLADGSAIWEKTIVEQRPEYPIHGSNSYATESPATDGQRIYVYFAATGTVVALNLDGEEIWRQEVGAWPTGNGFGTGSSLTIGDGKVFVQCDNDKSSFIVALDSQSGKPVWRQDRKTGTSWSTPLFWRHDGRSELIACGSGFVTSYNPGTGEPLWTITDVSSAFSASPAADARRVYFGNSGPRSSGPLLAVNTNLSGTHTFVPDESFENLAWSKMRAGPGMSSPVATRGFLYVPGRGILTCYSAETGQQLYKERINLKSMAASMWAAGDRVFLMDETGNTLVLKVGPEFDVVGTNPLEDDVFWSTPAVAGDSLLVRGVKKLYCIRQ